MGLLGDFSSGQSCCEAGAQIFVPGLLLKPRMGIRQIFFSKFPFLTKTKDSPPNAALLLASCEKAAPLWIRQKTETVPCGPWDAQILKRVSRRFLWPVSCPFQGSRLHRC